MSNMSEEQLQTAKIRTSGLYDTADMLIYSIEGKTMESRSRGLHGDKNISKHLKSIENFKTSMAEINKYLHNYNKG